MRVPLASQEILGGDRFVLLIFVLVFGRLLVRLQHALEQLVDLDTAFLESRDGGVDERLLEVDKRFADGVPRDHGNFFRESALNKRRANFRHELLSGLERLKIEFKFLLQKKSTKILKSELGIFFSPHRMVSDRFQQ